MALGTTAVSDSTASIESIPIPALPVSYKRKTISMRPSSEPNKVIMTYTMAIQTPKGAPTVTLTVKTGDTQTTITPTTTAGWAIVTVTTLVAKS